MYNKKLFVRNYFWKCSEVHLTLFHSGWGILPHHRNFLKYLENGTGRQPTTFWLLVYICFEFPCQFWQSFTFFWGSYEDFVGTPQENLNIFNFSAFDYYMNQMPSRWWWHDDVILWRHNNVVRRHKCAKLRHFQKQVFAIINAIFDSYCSFCLFGSYITHFLVLFHWFIDFWIGFFMKH